MNVRLEFTTGFLAGVYWQNSLLLNSYLVHCDMITATSDNLEQNIALERLKYVLYQRMQNSVFIDSQEKAAIKRLTTAGVRVIPLPEKPVDQVVGMMLYCKLDAVMNGRIQMAQLKLSSELGDNVTYLQSNMESLGPFAATGWWNDSDPIFADPATRSEKIVSLNQSDTWTGLNLNWGAPPDSDQENARVVVFKKDDKK